MSYINVLPKFENCVNKEVVKDIEHFFYTVNERILYKMKVRPEYKTEEAALGLDVEYFHFSICGDDRMRYMGQNIVLDEHLSPENKFCNAVITHLYGGRCISSLLTGITDPKKAHLDFNRLNTDPKYVTSIYENADYAKMHGHKFFGSTELHTSLQTAARNFCRVKYSDPTRPSRNTDIIEWVANWIDTGLVKDIMSSEHLEETYRKINSLHGVGAYYGYHLSVDSSLIPGTKYHHDEPFCVPGPGCCHTLNMLFSEYKEKAKKMPYGDMIVWIEDNQQKLYPRVTFDEALWNIVNEDTGQKVFPFEQDKFMVYGLEVGHCQYGIYDRLKGNTKMIEKRKCGSDPDLYAIEMREKGQPVLPKKRSTTTDKSNSNICMVEF